MHNFIPDTTGQRLMLTVFHGQPWLIANGSGENAAAHTGRKRCFCKLPNPLRATST